MNKQLSLLDLLIEKDQKSVPIPIQHQYTFPYSENKVQFSVPWESDQKVNYKLKHRPQNFYFPAETECPKIGTSYTTTTYGSYLLPIQPGNDVWKNLVSIL